MAGRRPLLRILVPNRCRSRTVVSDTSGTRKFVLQEGAWNGSGILHHVQGRIRSHAPILWSASGIARHKAGGVRFMTNASDLMAELYGDRPGYGANRIGAAKDTESAGDLVLTEEIKKQISLGEKYAHLPPGERRLMERRELKSVIKDQIKRKIKTRLMKEREDFYARQPKTEEERIELRIRRARQVIGYKRLELRKFIIEEPGPSSENHDPEVLTAEQMHYLKKMGLKYKNYVPVGKRGVYGGTIQNMHMHWKKHQTVRIDCHTFSMEETRAISEELARLSGGIVVDILQDKTIIMFRGRNYEQPKQLIPPNLLDKRKALKKALLEQSINSRLEHIATLERNLHQLKEQRDYETKKKQQAIEFKTEAIKSLPIRKRKQFFHEVGDAYDFEDDSDPCSETEPETDAGDESEDWSGEEDQKVLETEEEKKEKEIQGVKRFLWRQRRLARSRLTINKNRERRQRRAGD